MPVCNILVEVEHVGCSVAGYTRGEECLMQQLSSDRGRVGAVYAKESPGQRKLVGWLKPNGIIS